MKLFIAAMNLMLGILVAFPNSSLPKSLSEKVKVAVCSEKPGDNGEREPVKSL